MQQRLFVAALLTAFAASCTSSSDSGATNGGNNNNGDDTSNNGLTTSTLGTLELDDDGIVDLDDSVDERFRAVFSKYTALEFGQGRVHVLAQSGVADDKLTRAREILRQHLTDLPSGGSKDDVIQAMVDRGALLGVFNDASAADLTDIDVAAIASDLANSFVPLPATHIIMEGSAEYMQAQPATDLTFGATALLVHRAGLTVARPGFAAQMDTFAADAISSGEFTAPAATPAGEETAAFLAMVMDVHAGVHGHDANYDGTARTGDAIYAFNDREALAAAQPAISSWIDGFFGTDHTFQVILPEDFTGRFDGLFRTSTGYTARSQHLRNIRLTGANTAEIFAAPFSSVLEGNEGNNNIKGRAGDDTLYGFGGFDTAVFNGPMADYDITYLSDRVIVDDVRGGHEHTDTLFGFERLQFSDQGVNL